MVGSLLAGATGGASISIVINAIDNFSKTFAKVNKGLVAAGGAAVLAGGLIVSGMVKAGKAAAGLETEFAKVNTLLEEGQDAQQLFGKFVQETNVAMGNQGDQLDVVAGLYQTISAGITDTAEAQIFMAQATKTAVGGSAELSSVILAGTKAIASFGLEIDDTERVFDAFAGTVKAGQTTMGELANAFPTVAGMAGQAGITLEETLGTFAGLTKVLGSSEETATSLSATIRGFIKPSTDMQKAVTALGFESASAMVKEKGLNESLKMLNEFVDGDTEAMAKLFPNVRALKAVFPLLGLAADDVAASIDIVSDSVGLADKQYQDMTKTVQFQWGEAMSASDNLLTDIGKTINTVFGPAMEWVANIIKKVSELWLGLSDPIKKAVVIFAAVTAGILIVAGVIMILVGMKALLIGMLVGATAAIWGAVTATTAFLVVNIWWIAIILAIIAAVVAVIAIWKNWEEMSTKLKIALYFIIGPIMLIIAIIKNWKTIMLAFGKLMIRIVIEMMIIWQKFKDFWILLWEGVKSIFIGIWNKLLDLLQGYINAFIEGINLIIRAANKMPGIEIPIVPKVDLSQFKGAMTNISALQKAQENRSGLLRHTLEAEGDMLIENLASKIGFDAEPKTETTVNIENVYGTDPTSIAEALNDVLGDKISI